LARLNETVTAPKGFRAAGVACAIKATGAMDLGIVAAEIPCAAAAVFTSNRFCGCPVVVGREHVRSGRLRALVVNSGCSNVATGPRGLRDAREMCRLVGKQLGIDSRLVLPSSTGVIGRFLPMDKITAGILAASAKLSDSAAAGLSFARAILTTDLRPKQACVRFKLGRQNVTISGCAKGSGMIAPNMATMLSYITTDAAVSPAILQKLLRASADRTYNRITVDECQSTSDTVVVMASGFAENTTIRSTGTRDAKAFAAALEEVSAALSYSIVADGEGATRVVEVRTRNAKTPADAYEVSRAIAVSPLVKTAIHGGDPNWGRIVQAIGTTSATYEPSRVRVHIGPMCVFRNSQPVRTLSLAELSRYMKSKHVNIVVDLAAGKCEDRALTCDLSREYVAINADYTT